MFDLLVVRYGRSRGAAEPANEHRIVERIRVLRQGRWRESMAEFKVGDRVSFGKA